MPSQFAYRSGHRNVMRRRREWFEAMVEASLVLWWIPVGLVPTVADAYERMQLLRRLGPTPDAFTFRSPFAAPSSPATAAPIPDDWRCPPSSS